MLTFSFGTDAATLPSVSEAVHRCTDFRWHLAQRRKGEQLDPYGLDLGQAWLVGSFGLALAKMDSLWAGLR